MNREIKFRAWYPSDEHGNGGWIQGFNMISFHDYFTKGVEPILKRYDKEWALSEVKLCQYTGINDKNGRKIYEGDIITWTTRRYKSCYKGFPEKDSKQLITLKWKSAVEWEEGAFCATESFDENQKNNFCISGGHEYEVIGNIFQNPELLKGGNSE